MKNTVASRWICGVCDLPTVSIKLLIEILRCLAQFVSSGIFVVVINLDQGFVLLDISCTDLFASCPCSYHRHCIRDSQFHHLHGGTMNIERPIFVETDSSEWPNKVIRRADGSTEDATGKCCGTRSIGRW